MSLFSKVISMESGRFSVKRGIGLFASIAEVDSEIGGMKVSSGEIAANIDIHITDDGDLIVPSGAGFSINENGDLCQII